MISGTVSSSLDAIIRIHIEDANGQTQAFDMKIDTGFTAFVILPRATVSALGFPIVNQESVQLADGGYALADVHSGVVIWDGKARRVDVHAMGIDRLIGMRMLAGHDLAIRVRDGGPISIVAVP